MGNCSCCCKPTGLSSTNEQNREKERLLNKGAYKKPRKVTETQIDRIIQTFDVLGNAPLSEIVQNWQRLKDSENLFKQLLGVNQDMTLKETLKHIPQGYRVEHGDKTAQGRFDFRLSYHAPVPSDISDINVSVQHSEESDQQELCQAFGNVSVFIDLVLRSCRELRSMKQSSQNELYLRDIEDYIVSSRMKCICCRTSVDEEELQAATDRLDQYAQQFEKVKFRKRKAKSACVIM